MENTAEKHVRFVQVKWCTQTHHAPYTAQRSRNKNVSEAHEMAQEIVAIADGWQRCEMGATGAPIGAALVKDNRDQRGRIRQADQLKI